MGPRKFGFAPGGNNGDKYGISDVNRREYRDMVMRKYHENSAKSNSKITEPKIENAIAENKVNVAEENNIEANSPKVENAAGNMKSEKVDYIDWPDWRMVVGYGEKEDRQAEVEDEIADVNNAEISELKDEPIVEDAKPITEDMKPAMVDYVMAKQDENKVEVAEDDNIDVVSPKVESVTEDVNSENQNTMQPDKAREEYYARKHEERAAQLAQFRMNEYKEKTGEQVDKNESDRKLELRHQFDQIKLETDTFLKMQAGLGLMNEKEIRDYKDNLNKQEKNALEYMREGGDGSLAPMENLMKRSLDQISVFEANIQATPEYQEMERKKALVKKGLDAIKERRGNDAELGVNDFHFKEKAYKMQANLAEREFLAKAFSAEDKKNTNEALNAATEKFNKLDEEAIKLTRELKAGGRKLTFEDYQKIDAAWGASAAAEAKVNEIKNADRKEIAFDFAKNQYEKVHKGEQMNGVEGSFLSKFNVLTGEDTIEKFEPTVKDKMGEVAAKMTNKEDTPEGNPEGESGDNPKGDPEVDPSSDSKDPEVDPNGKPKDPEADPNGKPKDSEADPNGKPKDSEADPNSDPKDPEVDPSSDSKDPEVDPSGDPKDPEVDPNGKPKDPEADPNGKPKDSEADPSDSEKDKKKGLVAGVIDKIKKHSHNIKLFLGVAGAAVAIAFLAQSGSKFFANNTAVEQGMDKDNNGNTDGNVEEALEKHDNKSEVDALIKGNSFNVMVDGNETKIELNDNINPEFPGFIDSRRSGNDMTFVDRSGLESLKEQGASSEALGAEGMKEILNTMENPNMASYLGASFGAFEMADSPTAVNDITYMIQHGDAEAQVAIKEKANNTIANFLEGSTLKLGSIMNETYQSGYASNNGGEGNLQVDMALDKDGVFHKDQAVEFVYAENKDGENIMDMNVRDGFKENSLRALGVIEKNASDGEVMNIMSSIKILGINVKCGQVIFQYLKTEKKEVTKTVDKTEVTTSVVTPENVEVVENKEPEPSKPKNETPAPTPKENPKTPENNVIEGKTNTASANEGASKRDYTNRDSASEYLKGEDERNAQTNLPGSEITDKAQFDAMVREAAKQDLTPNSFITTQDNSQGIVHQEGVATEKQTDAENRSVLAEEKPVVSEDIQGSHSSEEKTLTDNDIANAVNSANSDNKVAHESGQTRTVDVETNSEQ